MRVEIVWTWKWEKSEVVYLDPGILFHREKRKRVRVKNLEEVENGK